MNVQVIQVYNTHKIFLIEINPHFATSLHLTVQAGINIPELLISNYINPENKYMKFNENSLKFR